ncbi:drebrin-like isoform X1 [Arapaima gigas]
MRAINLDTYSLSLLTAKEDIMNPRSSTDWALFMYDGATNNLKLSDSGVGGVDELARKFHANRPLYGLCRVVGQASGSPRIVMINWVGEAVDEHRRKECASHIPAIKAFFKEAHVFISASRPEDVTQERICQIASKVSTPAERIRRNPGAVDKEETVGTNYRKTNAALEMRRINRDSFWARAEREEEARKEEERRKAAEERRRWERERILQERKEEEERDRKMNEKLQMIEEQKRRQAKLEAEIRKQERLKWEQQQREHEEDMRARFRRSESIEKAAEAAVLVSQRSINPREFFRQLSSSSSGVPPSPSSPGGGRPPFRRYQRSLTDTAFIFTRPESLTPSSPRSPTVVSPFSQVPSSSLHQSTSPQNPSHPETSFWPLNSPQHPHGTSVSPSGSPQRSPPTCSLPSLPPSRTPQLRSPLPYSPSSVRADVSSPSTRLPSSLSFSCSSTQPLTPPDSPVLKTTLSQPPRQAQPDHFTPPPSLDSTPAPEDVVTSHPVIPETTFLQSDEMYTATRMLTDLEPDTDLTVKAVLVDTCIAPVAEEAEDEEDQEHLEYQEVQKDNQAQEDENEETENLKASAELEIPSENSTSVAVLMDEHVSPSSPSFSDLEGTMVDVQADSAVEVKVLRQDAVFYEPEVTDIITEPRQPVEEPVEVSGQDSVAEKVTKTESELTNECGKGLMGAGTQSEEDEEELRPFITEIHTSSVYEEPILAEQPEEEEGEEEEEVEDEGEEKEEVEDEREKEEECEAVYPPQQEVATAEEHTDMEDINQSAVHSNLATVQVNEEELTQKENGFTEEHNGRERSPSPPEIGADFSDVSQERELISCAVKHERFDKDFIEEMSETEQEPSPDGQLCVRALYDYQAEDDSELSLEPGDIIRCVETVDKAWWRGCSKDGRQGLFPANYVETI